MKRFIKFINESAYVDIKGELKDFDASFSTEKEEIKFNYLHSSEDDTAITHWGTISFKGKEYSGFIAHGKVTDKIYWGFKDDKAELFDPQDSHYEMEKLAEEIVYELER
jgi:hypothetical protein